MPTAETTAFPDWLVELPPHLRVVGIFFFTFFSEEAATVTSALMTEAGLIPFGGAFVAAVLGIWLSDAGLYGLGRFAGRPALGHRWMQRLVNPARVTTAEAWFGRQGSWLLVTSRFLPGTRLPTFIAAGILQLSFIRFMVITGIAAVLWSLGVFAIIGIFGEELLRLIERWQLGAVGVVAAIIVLVVLVKLAVRLMGKMFRRSSKPEAAAE